MTITVNGSTRTISADGGIGITAPITVTTSVSTPNIISAAGALGITPAAGSNLNISLSTTGDFVLNTNQLYVDTSAGYVGIGGTAPVAPLDVRGPASDTTSVLTVRATSIPGTNNEIFNIYALTSKLLKLDTNTGDNGRLTVIGNGVNSLVTSDRLILNSGAYASHAIGIASDSLKIGWDGTGSRAFIDGTTAIAFEITDVEKMRLTSTGLAVTGTIKGSTTIGVGNATPAASGAGITFPATQSASSDANTLDDYEEGTWTAELRGSTAQATTPVTISARYTKIGDVCHIQGAFTNVNTTGASGQLQITGMPFPMGTFAVSISIGAITGLAYTGPVIGLQAPSGTTLVGWQWDASGTATAWNITAGTGIYLFFQATYNV